jgi:hypothetical protein
MLRPAVHEPRTRLVVLLLRKAGAFEPASFRDRYEEALLAHLKAGAVAAGEAVQQFEGGAVKRAERLLLNPVGDHPPQQLYGRQAEFGRPLPRKGRT